MISVWSVHFTPAIYFLNKRVAITYVQLQFYYWVRHLSTAAHKKELKSVKKLLKTSEKFQNSAKNLKH